MKKICQLQPGDIFTWMDARFVVLEHQDDGTAVLTEGKIGNSLFQSEDTEHPCDYSASTAKKKIDSFAAKLADDCGIEGELIPFEVDLRPTDMSDTGYGEITVLAAPLTLWQYGKYKHLIPLLDDWWWLATPMWPLGVLPIAIPATAPRTPWSWAPMATGATASARTLMRCAPP